MSSAFKTLKTSDITVYPYKANKSFSFESSSLYGNGIFIFNTVNIDQTATGSLPAPAIYYRSARQLYYSHYVPSLAPNMPLSEQTYGQLEETQFDYTKTENYLIFDNYLQSTAASGSAELDNRYRFPTGSGATVQVLTIPTSIYGEQIKPGSFKIAFESYNFVDDTNGNLILSGSSTQIGNIIYPHGIVLITTGSAQVLTTLDFTLSFKSQITIYESQIRCHVNENELNMTQNPSATSGSRSDILQNNVTGSDFAPYVTTVGLYNAANELLVVGKLSRPTSVPSNTDITFIVKYDA